MTLLSQLPHVCFSQLLVVQKIFKAIVKVTVLVFEKYVSAQKSNKGFGLL